LGKKLLEKINAKIQGAKEKNNKQYIYYALCCSPHRNKNDGKLSFWINTGRPTNIDGWKSEEEIEQFLKSDGTLVESK
jgi:hypothetical protein